MSEKKQAKKKTKKADWKVALINVLTVVCKAKAEEAVRKVVGSATQAQVEDAIKIIDEYLELTYQELFGAKKHARGIA